MLSFPSELGNQRIRQADVTASSTVSKLPAMSATSPVASKMKHNTRHANDVRCLHSTYWQKLLMSMVDHSI